MSVELFETAPAGTFGPAYDVTLDQLRLAGQHNAIRDFMLDGLWRTLHEIATTLKYPEPSVSAQLRHLRKPHFGAYCVQKRRRDGTRTWDYQVLAPGV